MMPLRDSKLYINDQIIKTLLYNKTRTPFLIWHIGRNRTYGERKVFTMKFYELHNFCFIPHTLQAIFNPNHIKQTDA